MGNFTYHYNTTGTEEFQPVTNQTTALISNVRTVAATYIKLFDHVFLPTSSKASVRLAFYNAPNVLAICFPLDGKRVKVTCPVGNCRAERNAERFRIFAQFSRCRFYVSEEGEGRAEYSESSELGEWMRKGKGKRHPNLLFEGAISTAGSECDGTMLGHKFFMLVKRCNERRIARKAGLVDAQG